VCKIKRRIDVTINLFIHFFLPSYIRTNSSSSSYKVIFCSNNFTFYYLSVIEGKIVTAKNNFIRRRAEIGANITRKVAVDVDRSVHRVLVGKPEGKRPLGRPRCRWEDNIKINLQEVGRDRGDWMELAQDRDRWRALVGTVRNFRVP
jgi:hypothetical protein